ncbi:hypothetical protein [Pseudodesulfovibrio sp. zrk46]|uniref:hypothetical protein n=1 Tax=Pseudodesulfovibrio sp. zrk46 TaxID=2725288 RepID=UPI0014497E82|nr:hypothetical protein [Pseudodesulfovibrio sp. zrk46]QJB57463.1 hypothetical protein HFN16_14070 [Pseudodesulfovibrio sp. zrk46]
MFDGVTKRAFEKAFREDGFGRGTAKRIVSIMVKVFDEMNRASLVVNSADVYVQQKPKDRKNA